MIELSDENWSGSLLLDATSKARGRIDGYSWYFQLKGKSLVVEIADDPQILPKELPLVGFGCGGWLYENEQVSSTTNEEALIEYINKELLLVFSLFKQNKLNYIPAVSCPCSE
ncbi:hypothetical protein AHAT_03720 [Agarivorans sp. Toyoura001]|uniref:hypothetical protein n=1 Tax=Agarivorans sp. Toyoura001 TaxID=2283141 RepID=UPI0010EFC7F0|nr:hypothetical protein [Agarivorans sp. Toyoura001]GDY24482.1 hypothetical protein AHAT_03720 [Agarivorans sp. Toyoura001]